MIDGTQHPKPQIYPPSHVLIDSCDDPSNPTLDEPNVDWWVAPNGATLGKGFFVVDLGCQRCVSQLVIRNSQNGSFKDR